MQLGHYKNVSNCVSTIVKREGIKAFYLSLPTTLMMNIPYGCIMVAVNESAVKVLNPKGEYSFGATMTAGSIAGAIAAALTNPLDVIKTRLQTQNLEPCTSQSQIAITKVTRTKVPFEASCIASPVNKGIIDSNHSPKVGNSSSLGFNILKSSSILNTSSTSTQIISDSIVRTYTSTSINSVGSTDKTNIDPEGKIKVTYKSALDCARHIFREEGYKGFLRGLTPRMLQHAPAVAISWTTYETMKKLLST